MTQKSLAGGGDGRVVLDPERLKALRKTLGMSQSALAERCFDQRLCLSIASIKRAETGKSVLYRTARHLAELYGIELGEVLRGSTVVEEEDAAPLPPPDGEEHEPRRVIALHVAAVPPALREACAQLMQQFGGTPAPVDGGILALFGVPRAYRSDGLRCMQCALEIAAWLKVQQGGRACTLLVDHLHWPLPGAGWQPPQLPGPAPELAVERGLAHALAGRFVFAPGEGDYLRYRQRLRSDQMPQYALMGRDIELRQLKVLLAAALSDQTGHVVYIRGVAGIGKSRLAQEFAEMAQQHLLGCHSGAVLDFGDHGRAGWLGQLICSLLRLAPETGELEQQLAARLQALRLPPDHAMFYRPWLDLPQSAEHGPLYAAMSHQVRAQRQQEALRTLLLRETIERPAVVLVEDVHWAESAALEVLGGLIEGSAELPIIWVLTSRLEQDPLEPVLRGYLGEQPLTVLDLAPLRSVAASALTSQFPDADPGFRSRCVARAQGNPLFLTQLLLAGQARVLPESLQNLVQSKLDLLSPLDRRALRVAAVIGQRFSLALLRAALGEPGYVPELPQRHYLVRQVEPGIYQFIHDLILQGIYEAMPQVQRDYLHIQLAQQYGEQDSALCALHLDKARSAQAPATFLIAIRQKLAQHQYPAALELIKQCAAIDYSARDDFQLSLLAGQVTLKLGLTQEARVHYREALQAAPGPAEHLEAVLGLARTLNVLEQLEAEEALLDEALPLAAELGAHAISANLCYLKGNIYFPRGDSASCRTWHTQALAHAQKSADVEMQVRALSGLGDSWYAAGRMGTALDAFRNCVQLCEQHGLAEIEASNRFMLATTRIYANETEGALRDALLSAELGQRVGNRRAEIVSRLTAGWVLLSLSRLDEAQQQIVQGLELARAMGAARFEAFLLESQARVHLARGQLDQARHQIRSAWQIVEQQRLQHFIGPWVLGTLALLEERKSERSKVLAEGAAWLERGCVGHNYYRFLVSAAEASLLGGETAQALDYAARIEHYMGDEPCAWGAHHVELVRRYASWHTRGSGHERERLREQLELGVRAGLAMATPRLNQQVY